MAWNSELIVTYPTVTDMLNAGVTGVNQVANGTICIVENDNNNSYVYNGSINKWKTRHGNVYTKDNLPPATIYNNDVGVEIWDSSYKLKRRWSGTEWELQKDVVDLMLCGYGEPNINIGKYGNYYTDLNTNKIYSRNILTKSKIDALSMFDSGTLTVSASSGYTFVNSPRCWFVDKIGSNTWEWEIYVYHSKHSVDGYLIFDFNGSPQKINEIVVGFGNTTETLVNSMVWYGSNTLIDDWELLGSHGGNTSGRNKYRNMECDPHTEYRYYKCEFDIASGKNKFYISDLWFYSNQGESNWILVDEPQSNKMYFSEGAPNNELGSNGSLCVDVTNNDLYKKDLIEYGKCSVSNVVSGANATNWIDNDLTTYVVGAFFSKFTLTEASKIEKIILKRYAGNVLNCYHFSLFGSNDDIVWNLLHSQGSAGDVYRDIEIDITNTKNIPYKYFRIRHNSNSRLTEIEFYTKSLISWRLIGNLNSLTTTNFNNQLDSSIINLQLLADHINAQNPTINITSDRTITADEFKVNARFKVINTEPILITIPELTTTHNNKSIEIIKLGKGDIVVNSPTQDLGKLNFSTIVNNTGNVGESIHIEFANEVPLFLTKVIDGSWVTLETLPVYSSLQSVSVEADGKTWSLTFSDVVHSGEDGFNDGLMVSTSLSGTHTLTYVSGSGTNTLVYTSNLYVDNADLISGGLNYTQPGQGIKDSDGNSIKSFLFNSIVNSSQLSPPMLVSCTIEPDGVTWVLVFNTPMNQGSTPNTFSVSMTTIGNVTLTYQSGGGSDTIYFTGNIIVPSHVTVSDGLNFDGTSKSWKSVDKGLILRSFSDFTIINNSAI